jgi:hypothetical protein
MILMGYDETGTKPWFGAKEVHVREARQCHNPVNVD